MPRFIANLVVVVAALGCGGFIGQPVDLLTGTVPGYTDSGGCFTNFALGELVIDPRYGTAIADGTAMTLAPVTTPVMWRPGFTARRVGVQITVFDPMGNEVASTGGRYRIDGGYWFENPRVFVACGFVTPR